MANVEIDWLLVDTPSSASMDAIASKEGSGSASSGDKPQSSSITGSSTGRVAKLYAWGGYQAGETTQGTLVPRLLSFTSSVKKVFCGYFHAAAILDDDRVFCWGQGRYGKLGTGDEVDRRQPFHISRLDHIKIKVISCGKDHTIAYSDTSKEEFTVWAWGNNNKCQIEARYPDIVLAPERITNTIGGVKIRDMVAGTVHSCAITRDDTVYVWGATENSTKRVQVAKNIKDASFTDEALVLLSRKGEVFLLNLGTLAKESAAFKLAQAIGLVAYRRNVEHTPANRVKMFHVSKDIKERFTAISSGAQHIVGIAGGKVYTFGLGFYGSLGHGVKENAVPAPKHVKGLVGETVIKIACGAYHTVALTATACVYTWGSNKYGCLGMGDTKIRSSPMFVEGLEDRAIDIIAAGGCCSFAIDDWRLNEMLGFSESNKDAMQSQLNNLITNSPYQHMSSFLERAESMLEKKSTTNILTRLFSSSAPFQLSTRQPEFTVYCGYFVSSLTIHNPSKRKRQFFIQVDTSMPWIRIQPRQGNVVPQATVEVKIKIPTDRSVNTIAMFTAEGDSDRFIIIKTPSKYVVTDNQFGISELKKSDFTSMERVSSGGSGAILYKANWGPDLVAVKVWKQSHEDNLDEFRREITILSQVQHPNIVLLMAAVIELPEFGIVMEYMEGGSLYSRVHQNKTELSAKEKINILLDTTKGMNHIHRRGFVHADLKSLNLLLSRDCTITKICDFGLSNTTRKPTDGIIGSTHWMAPEVITNSGVSKQSDVYSFGVVMWEVVVGQPIYPGLTQFQIRSHVLEGNRPEIPQDVDKSVVDILQACWSKQPDMRPSFSAIWKQLRLLPQLSPRRPF